MNYPQLEELIKVVWALRHPASGCPWDLEQSHESLLKYMVEECYEYLAAVDSGDDKEMADELGDVLLQVVLNSVLAEQRGAFTFEDVAQSIREKLVRRHPHVFTDLKVESVEEIKDNWEKIKKEEKPNRVLSQELLQFPSLISAHKIGKKSSKVGFDWEKPQQVFEKVLEEVAELKEAAESGDKDKIQEEMGDLLFSVAQYSRHMGFEAETVLRGANAKFLKRFSRMLEELGEGEEQFTRLSSEEKEELWMKAKSYET